MCPDGFPSDCMGVSKRNTNPQLSNEKHLRCVSLFRVCRDCKDPYQTARIQWKVRPCKSSLLLKFGIWCHQDLDQWNVWTKGWISYHLLRELETTIESSPKVLTTKRDIHTLGDSTAPIVSSVGDLRVFKRFLKGGRFFGGCTFDFGGPSVDLWLVNLTPPT